MNILLVTEHFPPHVGGVEIVFQEYAKRLSQRGHAVKVITSDSGNVEGIRKIDGYDVHYEKCPSFFGHPLLPKVAIERQAKWADVVHTTTYTAALPALKAAKKFEKPCVLMVHEVLGEKWSQVEKNPLRALGFQLFEQFTLKKNYSLWQTVSEATKKDSLVCGVPGERIRTVRHGIDYRMWNREVSGKNLNELFDLGDPRNVLLYNGRPGQTKGVFLLLEAIKKIKGVIPKDFIFGFILSRRPTGERKKFERLVKKYDIGNIVRFVDSLPYSDLPNYRKGAFTLLIPSLTEGFGFVAAETCALGVPVIASTAGSLSEVVSGRALFFENGNADDLAEKILLATQNKFENIPERKFEWDDAIDNVESMYREVV